MAGQKMFGGYDCKLLEPPVSTFQTHCPICSLILRDPYQAKCCGTNFCCSCSEQVQVGNNHCPTCWKDNFEIFGNKGLKYSLNQLQILCTYSEDGCDWRGELQELEYHLDSDHSGESELGVLFFAACAKQSV